ncbi:MAG: hypothetical protein DCE92_07440, partial [Alphaproteobacteria bacterium]
ARTIETRLHPGDRLLAEASRLDHVRISIPIRMKMRGGRTWSDGLEVTPSQKDKAARLAAIKRLCGAHDAFTPTAPALALQRSRIRSTKAPPKGFSKLDWVFLAPGIQSAILNGRLEPASIARLEAQPAIPLSWAAQRRLLEPGCTSEHSCA